MGKGNPVFLPESQRKGQNSPVPGISVTGQQQPTWRVPWDHVRNPEAGEQPLTNLLGSGTWQFLRLSLPSCRPARGAGLIIASASQRSWTLQQSATVTEDRRRMPPAPSLCLPVGASLQLSLLKRDRSDAWWRPCQMPAQGKRRGHSPVVDRETGGGAAGRLR